MIEGIITIQKPNQIEIADSTRESRLSKHPYIECGDGTKVRQTDCVELSEAGKEIYSRKNHNRLGFCVGFAYNNSCMKVHWFGLKNPTTILNEHIRLHK